MGAMISSTDLLEETELLHEGIFKACGHREKRASREGRDFRGVTLFSAAVAMPIDTLIYASRDLTDRPGGYEASESYLQTRSTPTWNSFFAGDDSTRFQFQLNN